MGQQAAGLYARSPFFYYYVMAKIYLNSRTSKIGRKGSVRIGNMALRWCRRQLGINRRKQYTPVWSIRNSSEWNKDMDGEYDPVDNEIIVYWDNCDTVGDLIRTCIHEWTHQLQPILTRYARHPDYHTNPYEIEARQNETLYSPRCWRDIKVKVNKSYGASNSKVKRRRVRSNEKDKTNERRKTKVRSSKGA